jgi:hypothetical protein
MPRAPSCASASIGQAVIALRADDQIDQRRAAQDLGALGLRHAARDADLQVGVGAFSGFSRPRSE